MSAQRTPGPLKEVSSGCWSSSVDRATQFVTIGFTRPDGKCKECGSIKPTKFHLFNVYGNDALDYMVSEDEMRANADFIIRAWNSHDELLAVAQMWAALDGGAWHADRHARDKAELLEKTRAVIAKAQGGAA